MEMSKKTKLQLIFLSVLAVVFLFAVITFLNERLDKSLKAEEARIQSLKVMSDGELSNKGLKLEQIIWEEGTRNYTIKYKKYYQTIYPIKQQFFAIEKDQRCFSKDSIIKNHKIERAYLLGGYLIIPSSGNYIVKK